MSPSPLLLGVHITLALALTIVVGVQCVELSRIRLGSSFPAATERTVRVTLWTIPVLCIVVFATGGALLGDHAKGGPWVAAGVLSTMAIGAGSGFTRRQLRRPDPRIGHAAGVLAAVQWGIPAFTLAAAFLMADRPDNAGIAIAPIVIAIAVIMAAYLRTRRPPDPAAEVAVLREQL
ncbi:hypothetical protein ACWEO2_21160 [Nocardia sp. NPDC004278]